MNMTAQFLAVSSAVSAVVLVGAVCALVAGRLADRRRRRALVGRRVLVATRTGRAVDGVLVRSVRAELVLRDATILEKGDEPARADGRVHVDRTNIDYLQVTP